MKSLLTIMIAIVMVLSFTMIGLANTGTSGTQMTDKRTGDMRTYTGKVVSYDEGSHLLVVKGTVRKETFDVSNAQVTGSIQTGERVHVSYHKVDGKRVASSVTTGERTAMHRGSDMTHQSY